MKSTLIRLACILLYQAIGTALCVGADNPKLEPIVVGPAKQLFLDDYLIASSTNITRRVHTAEKHQGNPIIRPTELWEDPFNVLYGSVIRDGQKYRAWYLSGPGVSYAESEDGVHWNKPALDLVTMDGKKTNILFRKQSEKTGSQELAYFHELFGVFKDEREPDPARRYKMGFLSIDWQYQGPRAGRFHDGQRRGVGIAGSPDGIHWKLIENFATEAISDGATHWMFDPALNKHVLFGRTRSLPADVVAAWSSYDWFKSWYSGRAVGRIESADFVNWNVTAPTSAPVVMTADLEDQPGTEIYSMLVFQYQSVYIGLVQTFLALPDVPELNVQLAVSRDGVRFTRVAEQSPLGIGPRTRAVFLPNGGVASWDRFNQSLANNPPIAVGDDLRFYYGGRTYRHAPYKGRDTSAKAGCIGLATIKRDRFVSLEASFDGGQIVTKPLTLTGKRLHLNVKSDFGAVIVEAIDEAGEPIAKSKPIRADSLDAIVEWESPPLNNATSLRVSLSNACLYALWCD